MAAKLVDISGLAGAAFFDGGMPIKNMEKLA
jgi:hypothetical protein